MKPKVLQIARFTPATEEKLASEFDIHLLTAEKDPAAFLGKHGSDFVALATNGLVGASAAMIDALPSLKLIASRGVGFDSINLVAARKRGILVSNTPDVLTDCVADAALGALIAGVRGFCAADRFVRRGEWLQGRFPPTQRVHHKRLGILGLGRIGRAVAERASAFKMQIRYNNTRAADEVPYAYEPSLTSLASWADFLVVTVAGGESTRHLVNAEVISALGENGFLVNVSRGTVVDEQALVSALVERRLGGAALDVFEKEPNVPKELLALDNVLLLPHISSSTKETFAAMENLVLDNMRQYFRDGTLLTPV